MRFLTFRLSLPNGVMKGFRYALSTVQVFLSIRNHARASSTVNAAGFGLHYWTKVLWPNRSCLGAAGVPGGVPGD